MTPICECCGQRIRKLNPHKMDKQKCKMLALLGRLSGWVEVKAGRFSEFNGDDQVHAMRLEWFGLTEHGAPRSGQYRITAEGLRFLRGEWSVPKVIWCRDGVVVKEDVDRVFIGAVRNFVLDKDYWDNYSNEQRDD